LPPIKPRSSTARLQLPLDKSRGQRHFLDEVLETLERHSSVLPEFNYMMLKGMLQAGKKLTDLVFIEGNVPHQLIDNFNMFYMTRVALFKYSSHILDMEDSIHDYFQQTPLISGGQAVSNYRFADSKAETGIQLSDVVVGLLGKMHTYLTETAPEDVAAARSQLSGTSLSNAELLRDLIATSHDANIAFLNPVATRHDMDKLDQFLRFKDGNYA
jgi:hypothetical protein